MDLAGRGIRTLKIEAEALARLPVPIINVVLGEGGSGAPLAPGPADVILVQ